GISSETAEAERAKDVPCLGLDAIEIECYDAAARLRQKVLRRVARLSASRRCVVKPSQSRYERCKALGFQVKHQ
ncbi:hypothetical protein ACC754_45325, partial [Rhizobium johnstonii]